MAKNDGTTESINTKKKRRVDLIYDDRMCKHSTPTQDDEDHPECPNRIRAIWDLLQSSGIAQRCVVLDGKVAADNHLALVHTKKHVDLIKTISSKTPKSKRNRIANKFDSVYFNEGSSEAALLAAGSVVEVTEKVAKGELDSAFAIVRPPGHHAEEDQPMGFCLYNNVAVAASFLLNERLELGIKKVLIVDWDVHHGNGTQNMFYDDPRVLVFSVHRHDSGTFYPGGDDGSYIMTGEGPGAGYNINVPWENGRCGDADYLAVWEHILLPVANEFGPDFVIVAAGFDAAKGDPLGGCLVSPDGYAAMLHALIKFAKGKIVLALEGGYNLNSIAESAKACVEVLLTHEPVKGSVEACPLESTWRVIQDVCREVCAYWPTLALIDNDLRVNSVKISSSDSGGEHENESDCLPEEIQSVEDVLQPLTSFLARMPFVDAQLNVEPGGENGDTKRVDEMEIEGSGDLNHPELGSAAKDQLATMNQSEEIQPSSVPWLAKSKHKLSSIAVVMARRSRQSSDDDKPAGGDGAEMGNKEQTFDLEDPKGKKKVGETSKPTKKDQETAGGDKAANEELTEETGFHRGKSPVIEAELTEASQHDVHPEVEVGDTNMVEEMEVDESDKLEIDRVESAAMEQPVVTLVSETVKPSYNPQPISFKSKRSSRAVALAKKFKKSRILKKKDESTILANLVSLTASMNQNPKNLAKILESLYASMNQNQKNLRKARMEFGATLRALNEKLVEIIDQGKNNHKVIMNKISSLSGYHENAIGEHLS